MMSVTARMVLSLPPTRNQQGSETLGDAEVVAFHLSTFRGVHNAPGELRPTEYSGPRLPKSVRCGPSAPLGCSAR